MKCSICGAPLTDSEVERHYCRCDDCVEAKAEFTSSFDGVDGLGLNPAPYDEEAVG